MGNLPPLDSNYWNERWVKGETGWDIGYASPALTKYFDTLPDKNIQILIPGCGNAWEAEYLHRNGFSNVYVVDIAPEALHSFSLRVPDFPKEHLLCRDFFEMHEKEWDLIVEQTFLCALNPALRARYVAKMASLLKSKGRLAGLLFGVPMNENHPPFGGSQEEYLNLFRPHFRFLELGPCENSIAPRAGKELWFEAEPVK